MRHRKKTIHLGRAKAPRTALLRSLAESLILHEGMITTKAKAKALRTVVEPLITLAKSGTVEARRAAKRVLFTDEAVSRLFSKVAPRFKERAGGYTRIIKLGSRQNDAAEVVRIELV